MSVDAAETTDVSVPSCGNGVCESLETTLNCAKDCCGGAMCGDGQCTAGCETYGNCSKDCPVVCGDGACSTGENPSNCKEDCCGTCGVGKCVGYACGEGDPTSSGWTR